MSSAMQVCNSENMIGMFMVLIIEDSGHWMVAPEADHKKKGSFGIVKSDKTGRLMLPRGMARWKYKASTGWKDVMVNLFVPIP